VRDEKCAASGMREGVHLWCARAREGAQVMRKARSSVGIRNEREMT